MKINQFNSAFQRIVLMLTLCFAPLVFFAQLTVGCKSTATVAYKTVEVVQTGVETGLKVWGEFVVGQEKLISALPAASDEQAKATAALLAKRKKVSDAVETYKKAALAANNGVIASIQDGNKPATSSVLAAAAVITDLINSFTK